MRNNLVIRLMILLTIFLGSTPLRADHLSVQDSGFQYEDGTYNSNQLAVNYSGDMGSLICEVTDNYGGENAVSCSCTTTECSFYTQTIAGAWSNTFYYPIRITDGTLEATASVTIQTIYTDYIFGCTDPAAENYNPSATQDDGSCYYPENP